MASKSSRSPSGILDMSSRTTSKVIDRLALPCSRCGWMKASRDIHHIYGKKVPNCNGHENLSLLCPNCHREAHAGLIDPDDLMTVSEQLPDDWITAYYARR